MNIFVGNLPATASAEDLRTLFADYGTIINAIIVRDADTGLPLGHGHVYLVPEKAAREAIRHLSQARLNGHLLAVRECVYRARPERRARRVTRKGGERRAEGLRRHHDRDLVSTASLQQRTG